MKRQERTGLWLCGGPGGKGPGLVEEEFQEPSLGGGPHLGHVCPGRGSNRTRLEFSLLGLLCAKEVQARQSPS